MLYFLLSYNWISVTSVENMTVASKLHAKILDVYRKKPEMIREHYKSEDQDVRGYAGRPLLELIQNAEDALAETKERGRLVLSLKDEVLIVANEGAAFTERGLQALCDRTDSEKRDSTIYVGNKGTGFKAILNWSQKPEIYSGKIAVRFDREEASRHIFEALDPENIQELDEGGKWPRDHVALLRVPLEANPPTDVLPLQKEDFITIIRLPLREDAVKDITNTLKQFDAHDLIFLRHIEIVEIRINGECHCWHLKREPSGEQESEFLATQTQLDVVLNDKTKGQWHVWRRNVDKLPANMPERTRAEVGLAIPINLDDEPRINGERIFNFFPTRVPSPLHRIPVHATYQLAPNRDSLEEDNPEFHDTLNKALVALLSEEVLPQALKFHGSNLLDLLSIAPEPDPEQTRTAAKLWNLLVKKLGAMEFVETVTGVNAAPKDLRIWHHGLGHLPFEKGADTGGFHLPAPTWLENDEHRKTLETMGASVMKATEHMEVLIRWHAADRESAAAGIGVLAAVLEKIPYRSQDWSESQSYKKAHSQAPKVQTWLTSGGEIRTLAKKTAFFESSPTTDKIPSFIDYDVLDQNLREDLQSEKLWEKTKLLRSKHLFLYDQKNFLNSALLPSIAGKDDEWWEQNGSLVLDFLNQFKILRSEDWNVHEDSLRKELAETVRVPTRDSGWKPAETVFAGNDRKNPGGEEAIHTMIGIRFLLAGPSEPPACPERDELLRYLGVAWGPRWIRVKDGQKHHSRTELIRNPFPSTILDKGWETYWSQCEQDLTQDDQRSNSIGTWWIKEAWGLEGLDAHLISCKDDVERIRMAQRLLDGNSKISVIIGRSGSRGGIKTDYHPTIKFTEWQIENVRGYSAPKNSPLFAEQRAALSECLVIDSRMESWKSWLPTLNLRGVKDEKESAKLLSFALEHRSIKQVRNVPDSRWRNWLDQLGNYCFEGEETEIKFLKGFLTTLTESVARIKGGPEFQLPVFEKDGNLSHCKAREAVFLDVPRWGVLHDTLLNADVPLIVVDGSPAKKLAKILDVEDRGIEQQIEVSPSKNPVPGSNDNGRRVTGLLKSCRSSILALVSDGGDTKTGQETAKRLSQRWPIDVFLHSPLELHVQWNETSLGEHRQPFYREREKEGPLHLDSENWIETLAAAIAWVAGARSVNEDAIARLLEKADAHEDPARGAREFLRNSKGITEEQINEWEEVAQDVSERGKGDQDEKTLGPTPEKPPTPPQELLSTHGTSPENPLRIADEDGTGFAPKSVEPGQGDSGHEPTRPTASETGGRIPENDVRPPTGETKFGSEVQKTEQPIVTNAPPRMVAMRNNGCATASKSYSETSPYRTPPTDLAEASPTS